MSNYCYYCGRSAGDRPLEISSSFTAGGLIKVAHSNVMCDRCHGIMFGETQRVWYHNVDEDRWVALYLRGIHQVWQGDTMIEPRLLPKAEHVQVSAAGKAGKPSTYHELTRIPKRVEVREWLVNPPKPPFTIAIAESGQKHILYLAQEGYSRDSFPVQFEMDSLQIDRQLFTDLLSAYESMLVAGFSKTELDSGEYRADRVVKSFQEWQKYDPILTRERYGNKPSRLLQLISFVAIKPEYVAPPAKEKPTPEPKVAAKTKAATNPEKQPAQLTLF
jgi:hypothetical protein